ncbi:small ubiquitin-related modifier 3 isoform 1-T1 [Amazona ochrocephala]
MSEEKPKEGVKTENDHINLKVAGQDGSVVQFKIKRHTPLSKLMKAYCERQGLSMRQIRFRFDGQPINETDTPAQGAAEVPRSVFAACFLQDHHQDGEFHSSLSRRLPQAELFAPVPLCACVLPALGGLSAYHRGGAGSRSASSRPL